MRVSPLGPTNACQASSYPGSKEWSKEVSMQRRMIKGSTLSCDCTRFEVLHLSRCRWWWTLQRRAVPFRIARGTDLARPMYVSWHELLKVTLVSPAVVPCVGLLVDWLLERKNGRLGVLEHHHIQYSSVIREFPRHSRPSSIPPPPKHATRHYRSFRTTYYAIVVSIFFSIIP